MNGKLIVTSLIKNGIISENDRELYEYAVNSIFMMVSPIVMSCIIGAIMGHLLTCMAFVALFILLRKFTGGYHTRHRITCILLSTFIIVIAAIIINMDINICLLILFQVVSMMVICYFSPQDHYNYRLSDTEKACFRKIVYGILAAYCVTEVIFAIAGMRTLFNCIAITIISVAMLQIVNIPGASKKPRGIIYR